MIIKGARFKIIGHDVKTFTAVFDKQEEIFLDGNHIEFPAAMRVEDLILPVFREDQGEVINNDLCWPEGMEPRKTMKKQG